MAIRFSGEFKVKKKPEEVYDFLTDPNRFAPLLPEFQSLLVHDSTHFAVKVNVGISYIKGSADVKMELAEADRPRRAQYKGQGAVAGGSVTMVAGFDLSPTAGGVTDAPVQEQGAVTEGNVTKVAGLDPAPTANGVADATAQGQGAVGEGNVTKVAGFDAAPAADGVTDASVQGQVTVAEGVSTVVVGFDQVPAADGVADAAVLGTKVNWQGEAQIFGRLTSVAGGLLEPLAKKQIQKLIDGLQAALA